MFCRNCGKEIDNNAWVCMGCGVKVGQRDHDGKLITHYCDHCGAAIGEYQSICTQCGNLVAAAETKTTATRTTAMGDLITERINANQQQREQQQTKRPTFDSEYASLFECYLDAWRMRVNEVATRKQYWGAWFTNLLVNLFLVIIFIVFGFSGVFAMTMIIGCVYLLYALASGIIFIPLAIRRLHDAGFSGWLYLVNFIPGFGGLAFFIFLCLPSKLDNNPYR